MSSLSSTKSETQEEKAIGLDLVSGGENCEQTSAVLCDLWHHSQVLHARPREPLGRNAAQAVTDNVKRFAKNRMVGTRRWRSGRSARPGKQNEEFALKLATDKTASFIRVTQTESLKNQGQVSDVTGWLHIWEIADVDKFPYRPSDPDMMAKLMRFVSDCPSRPSEKPELAADEGLQYDCRKKQVKKHSVVHSSEVAAKSETTTDEQGFHEAKDAIKSEARAMLMSTKTKSKKSRSSTPRGSLEDDKADTAPWKKALWMRAANATKSTLQKALDDLENAVEQFETAVKKEKGSVVFVSESYIT